MRLLNRSIHARFLDARQRVVEGDQKGIDNALCVGVFRRIIATQEVDCPRGILLEDLGPFPQLLFGPDGL